MQDTIVLALLISIILNVCLTVLLAAARVHINILKDGLSKIKANLIEIQELLKQRR